MKVERYDKQHLMQRLTYASIKHAHNTTVWYMAYQDSNGGWLVSLLIISIRCFPLK